MKRPEEEIAKSHCLAHEVEVVPPIRVVATRIEVVLFRGHREVAAPILGILRNDKGVVANRHHQGETDRFLREIDLLRAVSRRILKTRDVKDAQNGCLVSEVEVCHRTKAVAKQIETVLYRGQDLQVGAFHHGQNDPKVAQSIGVGIRMTAGPHGADPDRSRRRHHPTVVLLVPADGGAALLPAAAVVVLQNQVPIDDGRQRSVERKMKWY
jgi:hypothetical protein